MRMHCSVDVDTDIIGTGGTIVASVGEEPGATLDLTSLRPDGQRPEVLLVAAIACCYLTTLSDVLRAVSLPSTRISVRTEGVIASDGGKPRFTRVTVHPTIQGADIPRQEAYDIAAVSARDACLIGRSIRGNVAYIVGDICLRPQG
jgi:organic hydroperoxide reductase OsmC/OhrA